MTIQKISSKKAFTLVELIIVIAIIAILAVTAFLLLTKWLAKARDASRSSNLANIENSLQISLTENSSLPKPDSYTLIYASGTTNVIGYQGYFGEGVKDSVGNINSAPKDGDDYFTYYLNADLNKYQLASFMENELSYNPNVVSAVDYASRYVNVRGDKLGLLTDSNKSPLQTLGMTGLDLLTGTASFVAYMDNSTNVAGTGKQLFTYYYNKTKSLLQNKDVAKYDDSLVGYWDMETTVDSGGTLVLKDLSKYGNNGVCYNSGTSGNCGTVGPQFVQGTLGKAMQFDGIDDYIRIENSSSLNPGTQISIVYIYKHLGTPYDNLRYGCQVSKRNGNGWEMTRSKSTKQNYFVLKTDTTAYSAISDHIQSVGAIEVLAGTYNGKEIKFFVDGLIVNKNNAVGNILSNTVPLKFGKNEGSDFANGVIDEVRIYNRALSDDEVKALYNAAN